MGDYDMARQRDQIEKIWDALDGFKAAQERHYTEFRELKTTVIGVDGKNGMRGQLQEMKGDIEKILDKSAIEHLTCPVAKKVEDHLKSHEKKEGDMLTAKRFYIGQMITILIFVVGFLLKR